ncbi:MAG TPA: HmuY family protein [Gemmatimonadaceae bacterium]|nr:HmuY family protein [Gemmatimonadaceae bacterium]
MVRNTLASIAVAATFFAAACEKDANPSGPNEGPDTLVVNQIATAGPLNASSTDTLVYFSFVKGKLVSKTEDWDIALRRYEVRLNGGVTGSKGVLGYNLKNNQSATDAQVLDFTVQNTLAAFDAVRESQIPGDGVFQSDRLVEDNTGYVSFAGAPAANAAAYWKVRTANGGYALMRVTAIAYNQQGSLTSITIESRLQSGTTLGSTQTLTVPIAGAPVSISLVTNAAVTQSGCNWDLQVNPQTFAMTVNTGCNTGTYPGGSSPTFAAATAANDAPQYGAFLAGLTGPIPNSVTDPSAPFRYNLTNTNKLHPAFNTYLVKDGTTVYKLQVINYYNESGSSGYPTIRYARIR